MTNNRKPNIFIFLFLAYLFLICFFELLYFDNQNTQISKNNFYLFTILLFAISILIIKFIRSDKLIINQVKKLTQKISEPNFSIFQIETKKPDELKMALNELSKAVSEKITKLKKIENYRSEFLGNVSHELRTPLFAIQGLIETLHAGAIDDKNVNKDFLSKALNNIKRLNTLLNELIEISRIESGDLIMNFQHFEINQLIETLLSEYNSTANQKNIQIEINISNRSVKVYGDKERLFIVLSNLLDNAIKYSSANTKIIIDVVELGSDIIIKVTDEGCGISEENLPRIFERFYRVDKTRSREIGGTGLGLSISKHIIEAHNSVLKVDSKIKKGSSFYFTLNK